MVLHNFICRWDAAQWLKKLLGKEKKSTAKVTDENEARGVINLSPSKEAVAPARAASEGVSQGASKEASGLKKASSAPPSQKDLFQGGNSIDKILA